MNKIYNIEYSNNIYPTQKKYLMIGGMDNAVVPDFVKEINTLYSNVITMYSHDDTIVLSGSGALLYYLHMLDYVDLITDLVEPNDVDFLLLTTEPNAVISVPFIGDHKRKQVTLERSATFENNWAPHLKFKSFDLTIPRNSITYHKVGNINLINLAQLKSYYQDELELENPDILKVRQGDELIEPVEIKKIKIIEKIQEKLSENPRPDIIGPKQIFSISRSKTKKIPINYDNFTTRSNLFSDGPESPQPTINKSLFADEPESPQPTINKRLFGFADEPESPQPTIRSNLFSDEPESPRKKLDPRSKPINLFPNSP